MWNLFQQYAVTHHIEGDEILWNAILSQQQLGIWVLLQDFWILDVIGVASGFITFYDDTKHLLDAFTMLMKGTDRKTSHIGIRRTFPNLYYAFIGKRIF
jgi:hypothetical protein